MTDVESNMGLLIWRSRWQRTYREWVGRESVDAKAAKAQETVLSRHPVESRRDRDASEAIIFHKDLCFLIDAILKDGPKPRVD